MRVNEAAVFSDGAEAVGIAIGRESGGALLADHGFLQQLDVRQDGLGIDAGEERIQFAANLDVIDAGLGEDAVQYAAAGAVHDVDGELEAGLLDGIKIDEFLDRGDVGSLEIGAENFAAGPLHLRVRRAHPRST